MYPRLSSSIGARWHRTELLGMGRCFLSPTHPPQGASRGRIAGVNANRPRLLQRRKNNQPVVVEKLRFNSESFQAKEV